MVFTGYVMPVGSSQLNDWAGGVPLDEPNREREALFVSQVIRLARLTKPLSLSSARRRERSLPIR